MTREPGRPPASTGPATRRTFLTVALTLPVLAAGCKGIAALGPPPQPAPDALIVRQAVAREELMLARYSAVIAASPGLSVLLAPVQAEHASHLTHLRASLLTPGAAGWPHPPRPAAPPGARAGLAWLAEAETSASAWLVGQLGQVPPALAQLLASIAASEVTHAATLGTSQPGPRRRHR